VKALRARLKARWGDSFKALSAFEGASRRWVEGPLEGAFEGPPNGNGNAVSTLLVSSGSKGVAGGEKTYSSSVLGACLRARRGRVEGKRLRMLRGTLEGVFAVR